MGAVIPWTEAEKAGFLPFIEKHERQGTQWSERVVLWKEEFGIPRTLGALRGRLSRCSLEGSYQPDKSVGSRSSPTDVNTQTRARGRPVKHTQNAVRCKPQRSRQTEITHPQRRSVWSVSPNREPSPAPSSAPTVKGSQSLPLRPTERPSLENHHQEVPNHPTPEEERLKYCSAFFAAYSSVTTMSSSPTSLTRSPLPHNPARYHNTTF